MAIAQSILKISRLVFLQTSLFCKEKRIPLRGQVGDPPKNNFKKFSPIFSQHIDGKSQINSAPSLSRLAMRDAQKGKGQFDPSPNA